MISSPYATFRAPRQTETTPAAMTPDPKFSPAQVAAISREILKCQRLLRTLWNDSTRREVLNRRAALYRLLYAIPETMPAAIDWQPAPHPQTAKLKTT